MALQTANPPTIPNAQLVGNAFVEQYYHILHHSPELVHRFYHDISVLSRPDFNGLMTSVTTMQGIDEKICSLDYTNYKVEIKTADAQLSYKDGVTVLVTGCLTGKDNLRRKFSQSFFLAPQENGGYFVLNDVFRYLEDFEPLEIHPVNVVNDAPVAPLPSAPEPTHFLDPPTSDLDTSLVEDQNVVEKAVDLIDHEQVVTEKEIDVESQSHANGSDVPAVVEAASSSLEDAPKQSYASIVKVTKGISGPAKVYTATAVKVAPQKAENQSVGSAPAPSPVSEASAPSSIDALENNDTPEEVEGHSIYIRNLPLNVTVSQLELEFKKFGPIKPGGVQVRNHKGYCFGFVEFLSFDSMDNAIQALPIIIGGRQAVVEIKKTSTRVGSGRGGSRFSSGRGGYWNDSFRGRGAYGGGRGFGRNDYGTRGGRSPGGRGGDGYQQGRGRGGGRTRQQNVVSS